MEEIKNGFIKKEIAFFERYIVVIFVRLPRKLCFLAMTSKGSKRRLITAPNWIQRHVGKRAAWPSFSTCSIIHLCSFFPPCHCNQLKNKNLKTCLWVLPTYRTSSLTQSQNNRPQANQNPLLNSFIYFILFVL